MILLLFLSCCSIMQPPASFVPAFVAAARADMFKMLKYLAERIREGSPDWMLEVSDFELIGDLSIANIHCIFV